MNALRKLWWVFALATPTLTGCDINALTDGFARMEGRVVDPQGRPVSGVVVRSYAFLDNLDSLGFDAPTSGARQNPDAYRVRVDVARLDGEQDRVNRVSGEATTNADGRYIIDSLPLDGMIAIAGANGGSRDIKGMDRTTGMVSLSTALKPNRPDNLDVNSLLSSQLVFVANFVVEQPPPDDARVEPGPDVVEDGDTEGEPLVEPDPEPAPELGRWTGFAIDDDNGGTVVDASTRPGTVSVDNPLVKDGAPIRVVGSYSDAGVVDAFLRIEVGGGGECGAEGETVRVKNIPITLQNGLVVSAEGEFQRWYFSGGFERYQLDLDTTPGNGNESQIIAVDAPCVSRSHPMTINLTWDKADVDVDLYVWDFVNDEPTYQGSSSDGVRGRSSYGQVTVSDPLGYGPEVFQLDLDQSGRFCVRANVFCGPSAPVQMHARITHWLNGKWQEKSFRGTLQPGNDWLDIGVFGVDEDAP
jgi:hypothetical protein